MAPVLPIVSDTWNTSFNNRITPYVSLEDCTQKVLYGLTQQLITAGMTVKGSGAGGTGAMDGVNRWSAPAAITPRATVAAASQAWIMLTNGDGVDQLLTRQGNTDDTFKFSFSAGGLFVPAGTANNQPTATDEAIPAFSNSSLVNAAVSGDRVWHTWISADHKSFRLVVGRAGSAICMFGQEKADSCVLPACTFAPASVGWFCINSANFTQNGVISSPPSTSVDAYAKINYGGPVIARLGGGTEMNTYGTYEGTTVKELQGGYYPAQNMTWVSTTTGARGKLANRIDWWIGKTSGTTDGEQPGSPGLVQIGNFIWPGNGVDTVLFT